MSYNELIDKEEPLKNSKRKGSIKDVLDGSLLIKKNFTKQFPYIFFLVFLAIVYISNRYNSEKLKREISILQKEQKDLRSEAITTKSQLMFMSKQSEVAKLVKKRGINLVESTIPPKKIIIKK